MLAVRKRCPKKKEKKKKKKERKRSWGLISKPAESQGIPNSRSRVVNKINADFFHKIQRHNKNKLTSQAEMIFRL